MQSHWPLVKVYTSRAGGHSLNLSSHTGVFKIGSLMLPRGYLIRRLMIEGQCLDRFAHCEFTVIW